ncbi:MAG: hypothetical protein DMG77_16740 [Acidobacteria bacterium]|nr:MAG: hypothetical protein DMG77_16740 [Acidobacteriota bacterium]
MNRNLGYGILVVSVFALSLGASARDVVLPAGTLLQCTLNEPNFSSATVDVGDPVLCHLRGITSFGQQAFPRGSYLVGHLESAKDPGHFWGKGSLKLQFDRIGLPSGDLPLEAKVIATRGYRVDREGKINGKGHPRRDVVEWLLPPLWPWKVIMLPARGPRPKLKGETVLSLRLMDDVQIPQVAQTYGPGWHFFGRPQSQSFQDAAYQDNKLRLVVRDVAASQAAADVPTASYASLLSRDVSQSASQAAAQPAVNVPSGIPVFVLKVGTLLILSNYTFQDGRITYTLAGGGGGVISSDEVDWPATTRVNAQRGVRVTLRSGHTNPGTPGL